MRGATLALSPMYWFIEFQSTRPMRGATRGFYQTRDVRQRISIHAPHAGRDVILTKKPKKHDGFQSTRPMRGATNILEVEVESSNISIHAPHAGRDDLNSAGWIFGKISIHAPHAGRDRENRL